MSRITSGVDTDPEAMKLLKEIFSSELMEDKYQTKKIVGTKADLDNIWAKTFKKANAIQLPKMAKYPKKTKPLAVPIVSNNFPTRENKLERLRKLVKRCKIFWINDDNPKGKSGQLLRLTIEWNFKYLSKAIQVNGLCINDMSTGKTVWLQPFDEPITVSKDVKLRFELANVYIDDVSLSTILQKDEK